MSNATYVRTYIYMKLLHTYVNFWNIVGHILSCRTEGCNLTSVFDYLSPVDGLSHEMTPITSTNLFFLWVYTSSHLGKSMRTCFFHSPFSFALSCHCPLVRTPPLPDTIDRSIHCRAANPLSFYSCPALLTYVETRKKVHNSNGRS